MRDVGLERNLHSRLDDGRSVWVVGDVHGHFRTLKAMAGIRPGGWGHGVNKIRKGDES